MAALPRRIKRNSIPELLARLDPGVAPRQPDKIKLEKTVGFVDSLLKYRPFQRYGRCMVRSLTLFRLLRQQGWPVEIRFGVRKTDNNHVDITGHSWLMLLGQLFLEEESHEEYATTFSYPSDSA